jgi:uncharacterized protein (DUF1015 family)
VDKVVDRAVARPPLFDFTAVDGVQHTIWRVDSAEERLLTAAFAAIPALYIADGHHRAASAARVRQQLRGTDGAAGEWDRFLAVAFPDDQMQVLPYNRVIKDLGSHTPESLLAALRQQCTVKEGPATPGRKGEVAMFLGGRWYTIELGPVPVGTAAADGLDVSRLQDTVLTSPIPAVAFSLYPVSVDDLMEISDAGGIMPPKSTWFEPKLRDGLLSHVI